MSEKKTFGVGFKSPVTNLPSRSTPPSESKQGAQNIKKSMSRESKIPADDFDRESPKTSTKLLKEKHKGIFRLTKEKDTNATDLPMRNALKARQSEEANEKKKLEAIKVIERFSKSYSPSNLIYEEDTSEPIFDSESRIGKSFKEMDKHIVTSMIPPTPYGFIRASLMNLSGEKKAKG